MTSPAFQRVDVWLVHGMLVGQTTFVAIWATLPWWRLWVGRALMLKSFALDLLIAAAVANYWLVTELGPYPGMDIITMTTHILILLGIWSQVFAIAHEIRSARRDDRSVIGTEPKE